MVLLETDWQGFDMTEREEEAPTSPSARMCLFCRVAPALPGLYACAPCNEKNKAEEAVAFARLQEENRARKALKRRRQ